MNGAEKEESSSTKTSSNPSPCLFQYNILLGLLNKWLSNILLRNCILFQRKAASRVIELKSQKKTTSGYCIHCGNLLWCLQYISSTSSQYIQAKFFISFCIPTSDTAFHLHIVFICFILHNIQQVI